MENKNSSSTNVSNNIKPTLPPVRCIDIEVAIFDLYDIRKHIIVPNVSNQMCLVPFDEKREIEVLIDTLKGLVCDVNNLLGEHDIEWLQAGYFNSAKILLEQLRNNNR